jgi:hypothetical protein
MLKDVSKKNRNFYEIIWGKNMVEPDMTQVWHIPIARCIPKATNKLTEYKIAIIYPLRERLREVASVYEIFLTEIRHVGPIT